MRIGFFFALAGLASSCATEPDPTGDCDPEAEGEQREVELWPDADGDGYTPAESEVLCIDAVPIGWLEAPSEREDCDDAAGGTFPGAPEITDDGIDQDCNGWDAESPDSSVAYVAISDPGCQDEVPGTRDVPNCSIGAAAVLLDPGATLHVTEDDYGYATLPAGLTYRGGYDPETWTQDLERPTRMEVPREGPDAQKLGAITLTGNGGELETLFEGFDFKGSPVHSSSAGVTIFAGGTHVFRNCAFRGGGEEVPADQTETLSFGVFLLMGSVRIEDSVIDGGHSPGACQAIRPGPSLEVRNTRVTGCGRAATAFGLDTYGGEVRLADVVFQLADSDGPATVVSIRSGGRAFITGGVFHATGDEDAVGLAVEGPASRVEVKNSAFLGHATGATSTAAVRISDGGTLVMANSLLHGGTGEITSGLEVAGGTATLINTLLSGGSATGEGGAFAVRAEADAKLTLVSNNFWGEDQDGLLVAGSELIDTSAIDACGWPGCAEARLNTQDDPEFTSWDEGDFELARDSAMVDAGTDPTPYGLIVDRDLVGAPAPSDGDGDSIPMWDVGPRER